MNAYAAAIDAGHYSELWVCVDCMLIHANGECGERDPGEPEPLCLIGPDDDLSMGLFAEHHADGCTDSDREAGCNCETHTFSWSRCDGCGSTLGGERHAMTLVYGVREHA